jgi:hypothetical protein
VTFIEALAHLQTLLGRAVVVTIARPGNQLTSIALLAGGLGGDAREILGKPLPEGTAAFVLGFGDETGGHISGYFVLDPALFEEAELAGETLVVRTAGVAITVTPESAG